MLSSLYRSWPNQPHSYRNECIYYQFLKFIILDDEDDEIKTGTVEHLSVSNIDISDWVEARMILNDFRYPIVNSSGTDPSNLNEEDFSPISSLSTIPLRKVFPLICSHSSSASLSLESFSMFSDTSSTVIQIATLDSSNQKKQFSKKSAVEMNDDDDDVVVLDDGVRSLTRQPSNSSINSVETLDHFSGEGNFTDAALSSPILLLSGNCKAHCYLLSVYSSATLNCCADCEIVIGAVGGIVVVIGCERLRLTVACRKLILINCLDCDIHVASLTASIICGVCRGLSFGIICILFKFII